MTSPPIAVQLYSLRDDLKTDFGGVIHRLAEIGYAGVEPFGAPDTLERDAQLIKDAGLVVPSAHVPLDLCTQPDAVHKFASAYGLTYVVSGGGPDNFDTVEHIQRTAETFNKAQEVAAAQGLRFGIHNHEWEYLAVEGQYPYQILLRELDPAIIFEVDIYWVKAAGLDPAQVLAELGDRAPLLHVKDGPATRDEPMVAVGQGTLDIPGIIEANGDTTEWLIVELDECATDMMQAVAESYDYLVTEGLGHGR